eukprot:CAMPEP_0184493274 /NCGR_PEP_ID=MMETSP0113_2-20130426/25524_1 /TAXON_ID=91329 /ORGANISM="Norrisiella sphaerica, Strain BC52" /LENGTH=344 /DNA_ID=CAMNT_0026878477 /DNA_START=928 /DNA_END=1963 /DNA_ORIENTATION=+
MSKTTQTQPPSTPPSRVAGSLRSAEKDGTVRAKARYFFGQPAYLTVSGQLNLEAYCCGMGDVYAFGPAFRAEPSHTGRHLAEFWMIEPEIAFADMDAAIDLALSLLQHAAKAVLRRCADEIKFLQKFVDTELQERLEVLASRNFSRITYTSAIELLESHRKIKLAAKSKSKEESELIEQVHWGDDLTTQHERYLCENVFHGPVVITDYPKGAKAFYMRVNDDAKTVAAFDVLLPKIGELIGGSQREERLDVLRERMSEVGLLERHYDWYLDLRRFGSIPHAGFGIGFDRLIQVLTGVENIRDVIPFPRAMDPLTSDATSEKENASDMTKITTGYMSENFVAPRR